eukprot:NODE_4425_length_1170_cov_37.615091_g3910_i0.p1 GENE.NODE_4425_length_1170_cov_37.615091_g3910_i0~~NODE_4425_length_1170_cov_37.615091_g3910_i0.p1  ORF type:complete len:339 (+),score=60.58 NODE_4425_length_1170_cov_37.615091_g3910_i0:102-1019(+)
MGILPLNLMLCRLLMIAPSPSMTGVQVYVTYFETLWMVVDISDAFDIYVGFHHSSLESSAQDAGILISSVVVVCATAIYMLLLFLNVDPQQRRETWQSWIYRHGPALFIDSPLLVMRCAMWMRFGVPISSMIIKNIMGFVVLRHLGEKKLVDLLGIGQDHVRTLSDKVELREKQLKEHKEAIIMYKAEIDRLKTELMKQEKILEIKGDLDGFRTDLYDIKRQRVGKIQSELLPHMNYGNSGAIPMPRTELAPSSGYSMPYDYTKYLVHDVKEADNAIEIELAESPRMLVSPRPVPSNTPYSGSKF